MAHCIKSFVWEAVSGPFVGEEMEDGNPVVSIQKRPGIQKQVFANATLINFPHLAHAASTLSMALFGLF